MKHYLIPIIKNLPPMAVICLLCALAACQQDVDNPSISCPSVQITANIENRNIPMNLRSSLLFRQRTDSGGQKFLSLETLSDSVKIVLNITDGMYDETALKDDSLHLTTYVFNRQPAQTGGLVAVALKNNTGEFDFLTTDSSSITIQKMNLRAQTISGSFYFVDNDRKISGTGTFENACYLSLQ